MINLLMNTSIFCRLCKQFGFLGFIFPFSLTFFANVPSVDHKSPSILFRWKPNTLH
jgi:hypothetical protein